MNVVAGLARDGDGDARAPLLEMPRPRLHVRPALVPRLPRRLHAVVAAEREGTMPRARVLIEIAIEAVGPGVEVFHVEQFGPFVDLYLYRDDSGRLRSVTPRRDLPTPLAGVWLGDLPPLDAIIATAFPKVAA